MARVLEVKDRTGRTIYLTDERYRHILKHPEMHNSLMLIEQTIKSPEKAEKSVFDSDMRYYYSYHKERKSRAKYLRVVVKYSNGEGFIITAFYVVKIT